MLKSFLKSYQSTRQSLRVVWGCCYNPPPGAHEILPLKNSSIIVEWNALYSVHKLHTFALNSKIFYSLKFGDFTFSKCISQVTIHVKSFDLEIYGKKKNK